MCRFTFSEWTASLNELAQGQRGRLPPTDARLRPDVRAIEEGRFREVTLPLRPCKAEELHAEQRTFEQVAL